MASGDGALVTIRPNRETMEASHRQHWEKIFASREPMAHSWYQPSPDLSLALLDRCTLRPDAHILDVGAGDSLLVDALLDRGYTHVHALDIAEKALEKSRQRLGKRAEWVDWIASDVLEYRPLVRFNAWHDRAAFHFLVRDEAVADYVRLVQTHLVPGGCLIIGTFSLQGPKTCSGLPIRQYDSQSLSSVFQDGFTLVESAFETHHTPAGAAQEFVFCRFRRN